MLFTSTFSTMMISAIDTAETAGNIGNLLFSLSLIFCGYAFLLLPHRLHIGFPDVVIFKVNFC